eukprot:11199778-Lingulodinium_polyedra.AAC.1
MSVRSSGDSFGGGRFRVAHRCHSSHSRSLERLARCSVSAMVPRARELASGVSSDAPRARARTHLRFLARSAAAPRC